MTFFKKKTSSDPAEARTYFEVYGDYLALNRTLARLCIGFLFITAMLLVVLNRAFKKPPLVIRIDAIGQAEPLRDIDASHKVTRPEVLNFVKLFMRFYLERNHYTWKENLIEAGRMMTPEFRNELNKRTAFDAEASAIESNKLTTKIQFSEINVLRETKEMILVGLKGWRQITSYDDPNYIKETVFEAELSLKGVARTAETPYGLLVDAYKQTTFKDE